MRTKEQKEGLKKIPDRYERYLARQRIESKIWIKKNPNYQKEWIDKNEEKYCKLQINYWEKRLKKCKE